jgi:hypothetical protein
MTRMRSTYDAEAVILTAGIVNANIAAGAGLSNEVNVGEGVLMEAVIQARGAVTGTTPTLTAKVQEAAAAGGSYTDVAGGNFPVVNASGNEYRIAFRTTKPWVALAITVGGTTPVFNDVECFIVG